MSLSINFNIVPDLESFAIKSMCFSPFSLLHALTLLAYCSNDKAIQQMLTQLKFSKDQIIKIYSSLSFDSQVQLVANIFLKALTVNQDFGQQMRNIFGFEPQKLISVEQINNWCSTATAGQINRIVEDADFDAILLSAIHFKDNWLFKFNKLLTHQQNFTNFDKNISQVEMMRLEHGLQYGETQSAQILQLKYFQSPLQALIILPKNDTKEAFLSVANDENLHANLSYTKVNLQLPKFRIESTHNLNQFLMSLGVTDIFKSIDCSQTLGSQLVVQNIIQKAVVQVDEEGTEAAAVTMISMRKTCVGKIPFVQNFVCNRPFWFLVTNVDGQIIMINSFTK